MEESPHRRSQRYFTWKAFEAILRVKQIGRWHNLPNGSGVIIVETDNQAALTAWIMGWSGQYTFPIVKPVMDDADARRTVKQCLRLSRANQATVFERSHW